MTHKLIFIFLTCFLINQVNSSNILFLAPWPGISHWMWLDNFVRELLNRGHSVTAITSFKTKLPHENYTEVMIDPPFDFMPYFPIKDVFDMKYDSDYQNLQMYWRGGLVTARHAFKDSNVQKFIHTKDLQFDLVISEQFAQESFLMFAHKYNCPIVTIGTLGWSDYMDRDFGFQTFWSFIPHPVPIFPSEMNFYQRCYNVLFSLFDVFVRHYSYLPAQDKIAKEYFKDAISGELPYVGDLEKKISVMLINHHRALSPIRPLMPGQINVAGAHIKPPKPLPNDIKKFLDQSTQGVVYMSLGSHIQSSFIPKEKLQLFVNVFKKLSISILWKYEDSDLNDLPSNVRIAKWMPQSDVLAHKNIKLFITHGGMFGSLEGLARGTPMLFIPFFGDQHKNALKAQEAGYAEILPYSKLSESELLLKINNMLNNPSYMKSSKKLSGIFHENPIPPMDLAMFWIEYVIKHNGTEFMKSKGLKQTWYQHFLIDVFGFFLMVILMSVALVKFSVKIAWRQMNREPTMDTVKKFN